MLPEQRVSLQELEAQPALRHNAPSIDIQTINFGFEFDAHSTFANIPRSENIAIALGRILERQPDTRVLIEGYTDATGPADYNRLLSQRRAEALKQLLVSHYHIPAEALEAVGYGEDDLLLPDDAQNPRNRRVTLRRIDGLAQQ